MAPIERSERFAIRMSEAELSMLNALAEDAGLAAADIVRTLVRDAYRVKFGDKPSKKPKSKK
jgi:hypothetical protein